MTPNTIVQADALEYLRAMPDNAVDCVITSPPYNLGKMSAGGGTIRRRRGNGVSAFIAEGYADHDDDMPEDAYQSWLRDVVSECLRVSKGLVWVNHKTRYRKGVAIHPLQFLPFPMWSEVIWDRGSSFMLNNRRFAHSHEYVFGFGRPHYWNSKYNKTMSVWRIPPAFRTHNHPCPFPAALVRPLIDASCPPDGVVLDPFMGSGTTALVARELGRCYVGCDMSADYVELARRQLQNT